MSNLLFKEKKQWKNITIEECTSCNLKMKRPFKLGDYIFKEGEKCQKCGSKTLITSIFKEEIK